MKYLVIALIVLLVVTGFYQRWRPLPDGISRAGDWHQDADPRFLFDTTWLDAQGQRVFEQTIFDEVLHLISHAEQAILLDMFLFNPFGADQVPDSIPLSTQLTEALIARKQARPDIRILVITDPFNRLYGALDSAQFSALEAAGIPVVETPLAGLRDSNPSWSALWRLCCQWFGNSTTGGWLPNPVGPGKVTLRTYLALLNFKANHRKVLVADHQGRWASIVSSANPHDASSLHSNIAVRFSGAASDDLVRTENAILRMAGLEPFMLPPLPPVSDTVTTSESAARLRLLTEGKIRDAILQLIASAEAGDRIGLEIFYFSHRPILNALISARQRGVDVRVLLDPSKDAFGRQKNGVPNRQTAWDLRDADIEVRFHDTHGEQAHGKLIWRQSADGSLQVISGSANFTRRNLNDLNLETDVALHFPPQHPEAGRLLAHFERRWQNPDGERHSTDYAHYADHSRLRYAMARFMEWSGWSAF